MDPEEIELDVRPGSAQPIDAQPGEAPPGTAELTPGQQVVGRRVVTHLPGMDFSPGETVIRDEPARIEEQRLTAKAPSAHDVVPGTRAADDPSHTPERYGHSVRGTLESALDSLAQTSGWGGRENASPNSLRRTARAIREDDVGDMSALERVGRLASIAFPAARTDAPITGADRRPEAFRNSLGDALLWGAGDEIGAGLSPHLPARPWLGERAGSRLDASGTYESRRDALRRTLHDSSDQAPVESAMGSMAGTLPMMGAGAPASGGLLARTAYAMGEGGLLGTAYGAGASEADTAGGVAMDAIEQGATEGLTAGALSLGTRALGGLARRTANGISDLAGLRQRSAHAGLTARGIHGRRAARMIRERPGGPQRLVEQLNEAGAPLDPRAMPDWIDGLIDTNGPEIGRLREQITEGGGEVSNDTIRAALERLARQEEPHVLAGGDDVARALRQRADLLEPGGSMPFDQAHGTRRRLDQQLTFRNPNPALATLEGQSRSMRRGLSGAMQDTADAAGVGERWTDANRGYAFGSEVDDLAGRGARVGPTGGMSGTQSRSHGFAQMISPDSTLGARAAGAFEATVGPYAHQELRMRSPGVNHRFLEAIIPRLERAGPNGQMFARMIQGASESGMGRAAAHYLLLQTRPGYRAIVEQDDSDAVEEEAN